MGSERKPTPKKARKPSPKPAPKPARKSAPRKAAKPAPREERRRSPRVNVNLAARWEGTSNWHEATVTNLSVTGCFVLSGGKLETGELVRLEIMFPDNAQITPLAEVVDEASEIGFAVQFTLMEDEETKRLTGFVAHALATSGEV